MNHTRSLAIATATLLLFALTAFAQQNSGADANASTAAVERHMKFLTDKLGLTTDQQDKVKPIITEMQDSTVALMHDESMSPDERMNRAKEVRFKADRKVRVVLDDEQKKKLDQLEEDFHPEQHADVHGAAAPPHR